MPVRRVHLEIS